MTDAQSDVPDNASRWTRLSYRVFAIGAAGALATIGTWVAIGSGPRAFSLSAPFVEMQTTGEAIGRMTPNVPPGKTGEEAIANWIKSTNRKRGFYGQWDIDEALGRGYLIHFEHFDSGDIHHDVVVVKRNNAWIVLFEFNRDQERVNSTP